MPAGSLEKLKTAVDFGADAVYLGGKEFSLRAFAGNLTLSEIEAGLSYARHRHKKVYITVNVLARNQDLKALPAYLEELQKMQVDGLIISDPGVLRLARRYAPGVPITISTQANVTNYEAAAFYRDQGAGRIVLARELSLQEIAEIKARVDIEAEVFVHGAMCVSYSGRCLLSHYMTGRSANSGACAHPCRYRYQLLEEKRPGQYYPIEEDERGSYILNSRDLCLIEYLPRLMEAGVDAFKVEGRMKSPLYVATVARIYRQAIDKAFSEPAAYGAEDLGLWLGELEKVGTRPFTNGFIDGESQYLQDINKEDRGIRADFVGVAVSFHSDSGLLEIEQRANFGPGEHLQLMVPDRPILEVELNELYDTAGNKIDRARHPRQRVLIPYRTYVPPGAILRRVDKHE